MIAVSQGQASQTNLVRLPGLPLLSVTENRGCRYVPLAELANAEPPRYLIGGILRQGSMACLYGKPGAGKSLIALDFALCTATGTAWNDREVIKGNVLYVACEGSQSDINERIKSWLIAHGLRLSDIEATFKLFHGPLDLSQPAQRDKLIDDIAALGQRYELIIMDTLAATLGQWDENSHDLVLYAQQIEGIRSAFGAYGATALILHHSDASNQRLRGFSGFPAYLDQTLKLSGNCRPATTLKCDKMRDGEPFDDIVLNTRNIENSAVLYPATGYKSARLNSTHQKVYAFLESIGTEGATLGDIQKGADLTARTAQRNINDLLHTFGLVVDNGEAGRSPNRRYFLAKQDMIDMDT